MNTSKMNTSKMNDNEMIRLILREAHSTECGFSNPREKANEALTKYSEIRKQGHTNIQFVTGPRQMVFIDPADKSLIGAGMEKQHTTSTV